MNPGKPNAVPAFIDTVNASSSTSEIHDILARPVPIKATVPQKTTKYVLFPPTSAVSFKSADAYGVDLNRYAQDSTVYTTIKKAFVRPEPEIMKRVVDVFKLMHSKSDFHYPDLGSDIALIVYYLCQKEVIFENNNTIDEELKKTYSDYQDYQDALLLFSNYVKTHEYDSNSFINNLNTIKEKKTCFAGILRNSTLDTSFCSVPSRNDTLQENEVYDASVSLMKAYQRAVVTDTNIHQTIMEEREKAIEQLYKKLTELHGMFVQLAVIIKENGELVKSIYEKVEDARTKTEEGLHKIIDAEILDSGKATLQEFLSDFSHKEPTWKRQEARTSMVSNVPFYRRIWDTNDNLNFGEKVIRVMAEYINLAKRTTNPDYLTKARAIKSEISPLSNAEKGDVAKIKNILKKPDYQRPEGLKTGKSSFYDSLDYIRAKGTDIDKNNAPSNEGKAGCTIS